MTRTAKRAQSSRMGKKTLERRQIAAIAARLRTTREALGIKPAELCRRAGIAPNTYSQWEKGHGRPNLDQAMRLVDALSYTLDWIYLGDPTGLPHVIAQKLGPNLTE